MTVIQSGYWELWNREIFTLAGWECWKDGKNWKFGIRNEELIVIKYSFWELWNKETFTLGGWE